MTDYFTDIGRNAWDLGTDLTLWGLSYLGPVLIPPVPTTVGMTDRAGTGQIWYLMWDGETHVLITNSPPRPYNQTTLSQFIGQDVRIYGPYDGPYLGASGCRLGITTQPPAPYTGVRLEMDFPDQIGPSLGSHSGTINPPVLAPDILGPQNISFPEPSNYPAPGVPVIPGIPSTTPAPTGGGYAAFLAAYTTNTPPLILPVFNNNEWTLEAFGI